MADNSKFIQTQTFKLAGGGISLSDTSVSLQSFKFPDGTLITMSHIGALGTGTLEPGASKEEIISFTGVTQNGDGSATLTGVTRGLKFGDTAGDYGQNLALRKSHAGNTSFVITNNPQFYNKFAAKDNDEVITGDWQVPTPANPESVANKQYVIDAVTGGVGTATDTTYGTVKGTKSQGTKPKVISALVREQATPDKTLKVESLRQTFIDKVISYAGGDTPNFIDPAMGGDLGITLTPANGETITITVDGTACVFTFVTTIGATPGNVLIGASASTARANLVALINAPSVTTANGVAFSGAQLTAIQKLSATDDLTLNAFIRVINTSTTSFSVSETMAGAGNIWTANTTKNRYDLVVIDNAGTLQIRKGSESVSPSVPTPTSGDLVLALILNRCGMTTVRDTDVSGQGYIVELYTPSIYRTDLAKLSDIVPDTSVATFVAGETLAVGNPVAGFFSGGPLFDAKTTKNSSVSSAGGTHSFAFSVANNSNRMMVVFVNLGMSSGTVPTPTVTYNGVSMTARNVQTISSSAKLFTFTLSAPATGSNTLAVTIGASGGTVYSSVAVHSYYNASASIEKDVGAVAATVAYGTPAKGVVIVSGLGYSSGSSSANNFDNYSDGGPNTFANICSADSGQSYVDASATVTYTSGNAISAIGISPASTLTYSVVKTSASTPSNAVNLNKYNSFVGFVSAITGGGVLGTDVSVKIGGVVTGLSSLTPLATYYLSNTSGVISTTAGTNSKKIGIALSATTLLIKHDN